MTPGRSVVVSEARLRSSQEDGMQSRVQIDKVHCLAQTGLELETGTSLQRLRQRLGAQAEPLGRRAWGRP